MKDGVKVLFGVSAGLFAAYAMSGGLGSKKKGHGLFDTERPEELDKKLNDLEKSQYTSLPSSTTEKKN